ncbi:substrate-binding domain-containing protein [Armatimonas sp.]|uniref:substrate-binding domain-containing protein n=1 Tax=Armatimonas sp. TaxID=1872638 RepID=UPI00375221B1
MNRRTLLSFVPLAALALMTGCKPEEAKTTDTAGGGTKKIKVVFIPKNVGNPYFDAIDKGMKAVCEAEGAEYKMTGPAQAEATNQIQYIKDEVQAGANVICLAANSVDALNNTLDEIRAKGVKVVTVDADITGNESHRDIGVFATDFSKFGGAILEQLGKGINYTGEVAILSATSDSPNQKLWVEQMNAAWKDPKYAKMPLVATVFGDDKPEKSATEMEGLLTKFPNLKGVIAPTTVGVSAAAKVAQQRGVYPGGANAKNGGARVFGLGLPKQMRSFIEGGVTPEIMLWSPVDMGTVTAYVCLALAKGELKAEKGQKVKVGAMGERAVEDLNKITVGPPTIFTKDNVAQFDF